MAIAEATLEHIFNEIKAFTLFSTHYSQITQKFVDLKEVKLMKLDYYV